MGIHQLFLATTTTSWQKAGRWQENNQRHTLCPEYWVQVGRHAQALRLRRACWFKILCAICDAAYSAGKLSIYTVAVDSTIVDSKKAENSQSTMATRKGKESKYMHLWAQRVCLLVWSYLLEMSTTASGLLKFWIASELEKVLVDLYQDPVKFLQMLLMIIRKYDYISDKEA